MLFIEKGAEPRSLTEYRLNKRNRFEGQNIQPAYSTMPTYIKDEIRERLLQEQGHLCAYCMRRLKDKESVKIEHWKAEKMLSEDERLDYQNMLGVCTGRSGKDIGFSRRQHETCDQHRGSVPLTVDPKSKDMISTIKYSTASGEISSSNVKIDYDLKHTLNLNCGAPHFLPENRKAVLDTVRKIIDKQGQGGTWKKSTLIKIRRHYQTRNLKGELPEYAGIVLWYIDTRLTRAK